MITPEAWTPVIFNISYSLYFRDFKFGRAQKRKSGAFRSAAVQMNELQRNIDGWEVGDEMDTLHCIVTYSFVLICM